MPVVAVVAAIAIDASALAGGIAAMSTLTAITAIGATIGAIGAVTHDRTLSLIGAGLGIVGVVGTLAAGSGALGTVGDLFGSSSAADTASLTAGADASLNEALASVPGASLTSADVNAGIINATGGIDSAALNATAPLAAAEGGVPAIVAAGQPELAQSLSQGAGATGAASPATGAAPSIAAEANAAVPQGWSASNAATIENGLTQMSAAATPSSGLMDWANKNPMMAWGALQAGGSFITGLTNPLTPAQIEQLNSQAAENRAAAALLERETANQSAPLPKATVTGKAAPAATGLINNRPVSSALITGTPNTGAPPASLLSMGTTA